MRICLPTVTLNDVTLQCALFDKETGLLKPSAYVLEDILRNAALRQLFTQVCRIKAALSTFMQVFFFFLSLACQKGYSIKTSIRAFRGF